MAINSKIKRLLKASSGERRRFSFCLIILLFRVKLLVIMYRGYGITYPFEFMDICEDIFNNLAGFIAIENKRTTGFFNLQDE